MAPHILISLYCGPIFSLLHEINKNGETAGTWMSTSIQRNCACVRSHCPWPADPPAGVQFWSSCESYEDDAGVCWMACEAGIAEKHSRMFIVPGSWLRHYSKSMCYRPGWMVLPILRDWISYSCRLILHRFESVLGAVHLSFIYMGTGLSISHGKSWSPNVQNNCLMLVS